MKTIPVRQLHPASQAPAPLSFSIRDVREMLAGKAMTQELHRHDYFFVLVLQKGKGTHTIDFTPYEIHNASVFFMRPGQVHELSLKAGSTGYVMEFMPDFYHPHDKNSSQLLRRASNLNYCQLDPKRFLKLIAPLTHIFEEYTDKREGYQEIVKANLGIFFIELVRNRKHDNKKQAPVNSYSQERLEALMELLETHISSHKQVSQYADMLNLSAYQLNAITREALGKTCSELINEVITLEAKRYILATNDQVNQIAYRLGYEDPSYFIRFFKKQTGYTPEAFRNNFK